LPRLVGLLSSIAIPSIQLVALIVDLSSPAGCSCFFSVSITKR